MSFHLYIIRCNDGYLYTGITWNLEKRLNEHICGKTPNIKNRLPISLVYKEEFRNRKYAAKKEKEIKGWRREKKENLIRAYTEEHQR